MRYASINIFTVRAGAMDAFIALQRTGFLPLLRQQTGFLACEIVRTGDDTGVATLWWTSEKARHAATPRLTAWVEQRLAPFFVALDNPAGPLNRSSCRPATRTIREPRLRHRHSGSG